MKKFYALRMKNGRSFIAATNNKGVCQFSINNNEFSIYSEGDGNTNFTFSVEKNLEKGEVENLQPDQGLEVVALQEVVIKKKIELNFYRNLEGLSNPNSKVKRTFLRWKETLYYVKQGGVQTPDGWIYGGDQQRIKRQAEVNNFRKRRSLNYV